MVDVKATLIDGTYHDVDSSVLAFEIAGSRRASSEGMRQGRPTAARADDAVEVVTPEEYMGDVIGDLNPAAARSGHDPRGNAQVINARCRWPTCSATSTPALDDPGPRAVHDAVRPLRAGAAERRRGSPAKKRPDRHGHEVTEQTSMAKRNSSARSRTCNIGTIGHVDHGKTTLTAAITKVLAKNWRVHGL